MHGSVGTWFSCKHRRGFFFLEVRVSLLGTVEIGNLLQEGMMPGSLEPGKDDMKKEQDRQKKELPRDPVIAEPSPG